MRGGKRFFVANKVRKQTASKQSKTKKSVKLSSTDWYKKAAASLSIKKSSVTPSPGLVPELD